MFHFYTTFLNFLNISSLASGEIIISSTGSSCFTILSSFDLVNATSILFPKNSPVLWTTFLKTGFQESSSVSNNGFYIFS